MNEAEDWAHWISAVSALTRQGRSVDSLDDPRLMVERLTCNVMLSSGPLELFSNEMPVFRGSLPDVDLIPIDEMFGRYIQGELKVEIFVNNIRHYAPITPARFEDLLVLVRIHEYAHAAVHTGISTKDVADQLETFGAEGTTDWASFRTDRDRAFSALDEDSHELLAQAMTWACIARGPNTPSSERLIEAFLALEARQPHRYRLAPQVRRHAAFANWNRVLWAARQEAPAAYPGPSFKLVDGLAALISRTAEPPGVAELPRDDAIARIASDIQQSLAEVELDSRQSDPDFTELLMYKVQHTELRMCKEAGHDRPHFHVEYKTEHRASYALDSFEKLAGYTPRKYEDRILSIARANQSQLVERWYSLNDSAKIALPEGSRATSSTRQPRKTVRRKSTNG